MRNKVKPEAVKWLIKNPDALNWSNYEIARELKRVGIYSSKTYVNDIRVERIKSETLAEILVKENKRDR